MTQFGDFSTLFVLGLAVSLLPLLAMVATSYTKIVIVLGLLRNALGVQQVPPNMVINAIALILSAYIMMPIASVGYQAIGTVDKGKSLDTLSSSINAMSQPFTSFLKRNGHERERRFFLKSAQAMWPKNLAKSASEEDLMVLLPAFLVSQLTDAFRIGFLLYLAFIVVDLVIANVLMAMGLSQVTPSMVSIPFKLLLFVSLDGWSVLLHGLVLTYR